MNSCWGSSPPLVSPQFCHNNKKAQKYLLGGFECLVKLHQAQLLPRVAVILKDLYDADLLEEDVIFVWAEKVPYTDGEKESGVRLWVTTASVLGFTL